MPEQEIDKCPEVSENLLKHLKSFFPDVLPQCDIGEYIREATFMRLIGHQDVIAYLESEFKAQQEEIKEDIE